MNAAVEAPALPVDRHTRWKAAQRRPDGSTSGEGGPVYGIGMIGALVYFVTSAQTGRDKALAAPKAIVWPALLVYKVLKHLNG